MCTSVLDIFLYVVTALIVLAVLGAVLYAALAYPGYKKYSQEFAERQRHHRERFDKMEKRMDKHF